MGPANVEGLHEKTVVQISGQCIFLAKTSHLQGENTKDQDTRRVKTMENEKTNPTIEAPGDDIEVTRMIEARMRMTQEYHHVRALREKVGVRVQGTVIDHQGEGDHDHGRGIVLDRLRMEANPDGESNQA